MIRRWAIALGSYKYHVIHRNVNKIRHANFLSPNAVFCTFPDIKLSNVVAASYTGREPYSKIPVNVSDLLFRHHIVDGPVMIINDFRRSSPMESLSVTQMVCCVSLILVKCLRCCSQPHYEVYISGT